MWLIVLCDQWADRFMAIQRLAEQNEIISFFETELIDSAFLEMYNLGKSG